MYLRSRSSGLRTRSWTWARFADRGGVTVAMTALLTMDVVRRPRPDPEGPRLYPEGIAYVSRGSRTRAPPAEVPVSLRRRCAVIRPTPKGLNNGNSPRYTTPSG